MLKKILCMLLGIALFISTKGITVQKDQPLVVILLGAPGSGKGTQAVKLSQKLHIVHISTGDLFREHLKNQTDLGKEAKKYLDAGKLAPDIFVLDMLFERLKQPDCKGGYLLDGFPRTILQAEELEKRLGSDMHPIVITLEVSDAEVIHRISGRRVCTSCKNVYHAETNPPQKEGICDTCKIPLIQRSDDTEAIVKERLHIYYEQTKPLEDFYIKKGLLQKVNGEQNPSKVFDDLLQCVHTIQ